MSGGWSGSDRKARLPRNWPSLVATVRARAATPRHPSGQCEYARSTGRRCTAQGSDVDHIERGDDHRLENLQLLCRWHHGKKSSSEGNQAQHDLRATARRPSEQHPGVRAR